MTRCFVRLAAVLSVLGSVLASVSTAQQAGTTPPPPFPREAPVDHGYAAWSPDDQRIAYMTLPGRAGTVFVTSIGGTPQAVFTDAAQYDGPAWSPDGTRFAFGSNRGGTWAIWVASANGSGARAITPNQLVEVHAPSWSRDGSRIAYSAISRLPVVMVASVNDRIPPRRLASGWRPRWSPDGNRIAYTDRYTEGGKEPEAVAIVPAEGGPGVRLLSTVRELSPHTLSADWSPDGRWIVVPRRIEGAGNRSALLAVDAEADTAVTLATVDCLAADPAWSHRGEQGNAPGWLSPDAWNVLMTIAVLLVWQAPGGSLRRWRPLLIAMGAASLIALAFVYRSTDATGVIQLRPQWWGILGLIGWSYLVAALVYLAIGNRPLVLGAATLLLYGLFFAEAFGAIGRTPYLSIGSTLGSHAALVVSGSVVTAWLTAYRDHGGAPGRVPWYAIAYSALLIAAGWLVHEFRDVHAAFWISKVHATPAWCLISGGITCAAWAVLYQLVEIKGWRQWPRTITTAGQMALLAYLIAPLLLSLFEMTTPLTRGVNLYAALGDHLIIGTIRSVLFACLVVWMCGRMRVAGFEPRL